MTAFMDGDCLLRLPDSPRTFFLEPLIFSGSLSMVYAHPGIGKTWFTLWLAAAMASEGRFLRWKANQSAKVYYVDSEMGSDQLRPRFHQIVATSELDLRQNQIYFCVPDRFQNHQVPNLALEESQEWYTTHTKNADVIIVDNLGSASGPVLPRETEEQTWLRIMPWLLKMRAAGKAVILVHHAGKSGAQLGTSRREQPLDLIIKLSRPSDYDPTEGCKFQITFDKARHIAGSDLEPLLVKLLFTETEMRWEWKLQTEAILARIEAMMHAGISEYQIILDIKRDRLWTQAKIDEVKANIREKEIQNDARTGKESTQEDLF